MIRQLRRPWHPFHFPSASFPLVLLCLCASACGPGPATNNTVLITRPSFVKAWETPLNLRNGDSVQGIYLLGDVLHVVTHADYDYAMTLDGNLLYTNAVGGPNASIKGGPIQLKDLTVFATDHTLELFDAKGVFQKSVEIQYNITNQIVGNKDRTFVYAGIDEGGGRFAQVDVSVDFNPIRWSLLSFGSVEGAAACWGKTVYYGSQGGFVQALFEDRTSYWPLLGVDSKFQTDGQILSDIIADEHSLYFCSTDGKLYCLDRVSGKLKWRYFAGTALTDAPAVTADTVYQHVEGLGLAALDKIQPEQLGAGEKLDQNPIHTPRWVSARGTRFLTEDDQYAYILFGRGNFIVAVDKQTGQPVFWTQRKDLDQVTAAADDSTIYAVTDKGHVLAIKPVLVPGSYGILVQNAKPAALALAH